MKAMLSRTFRAIRNRILPPRRYRRQVDYIEKLKELNLSVSQSLDLGSGPNPRNPFCAVDAYGVDIRSYDMNKNVRKCLLGFDAIPFESSSFDVVTAYDLLEHISRVSNNNGVQHFPFVQLMNEIWRVLKLNGLFYSSTPCFPMKEAFQDPTHVNIMTEDTLRLYFSGNSWARIYGFLGSFRIVDEGWLGSHYFCLLQKVSDTPVSDIDSPQRE